MNVRELIDQLEQYDDNAIIGFLEHNGNISNFDNVKIDFQQNSVLFLSDILK